MILYYESEEFYMKRGSKELQKEFFGRLKRNMEDFNKSLCALDKEEIILMSSKIASMQYVYKELTSINYYSPIYVSCLSDNDIERLLLFLSPLDILSDIVLKDWDGMGINFDDLNCTDFIGRYKYECDFYDETMNERIEPIEEEPIQKETSEEIINRILNLISGCVDILRNSLGDEV